VSPAPLLEGHGLTKAYGGVQAVRSADIGINAGRVLGLVGENGAGKSTLVKMLSGIVQPDTGALRWQGTAATFTTPQAAKAVGIRTIHQELELALPLTVAENVFMGNLPTRGPGLVDWGTLHQATDQVLEELGTSFGSRAIVGDLSIGDRQVVEIARAVAAYARVIFMDEPTSALPPREVQRLFAMIGSLKERGVAIVYISHRLDEILDISDEISVMRDGEMAAHFQLGEVTRDQLVAHILGRELTQLEAPPAAEVTGPPLLSVRGLTSHPAPRGVTISAYRGEVVGLYGLLGAGHSELVKVLFGVRTGQADDVTLAGLTSLPSDPREAIAAGVAYVPGDRKEEGLALVLSVAENILLPSMRAVAPRGVLRQAVAASMVDDVVRRYGIKSSRHAQSVAELSGGNQQKVVLGKWRPTDSSVILLDEPTKGVDVGARNEIFRLLHEFVSGGATCVLSSSDPEEVVAACHRAYVFKEGQVAGELHSTDLTTSSLVQLAL